MSSHSFVANTARGIQTVVRLYPWSVLWVLFAVGMVLVVTGSWTTIALVTVLVLVVAYHSIHREHADKERPKEP